MPEQLWFTEILNHLFAGPVTGQLQALHINPQYPRAPITNAFAMQLLVFLFLVVLFALVCTRLSVGSPGGLQHVFEGAHGFVEGQSQEIIGHHSERYTPFLMTLTFFILISNLLGFIPGFESPTAVPVVPLGCAVCASVRQHVCRRHGDLGIFLPGADWRSDYFSRAPPGSLVAADLYFCAVDHGVFIERGG